MLDLARARNISLFRKGDTMTKWGLYLTGGIALTCLSCQPDRPPTIAEAAAASGKNISAESLKTLDDHYNYGLGYELGKIYKGFYVKSDIEIFLKGFFDSLGDAAPLESTEAY